MYTVIAACCTTTVTDSGFCHLHYILVFGLWSLYLTALGGRSVFSPLRPLECGNLRGMREDAWKGAKTFVQALGRQFENGPTSFASQPIHTTLL